MAELRALREESARSRGGDGRHPARRDGAGPAPVRPARRHQRHGRRRRRYGLRRLGLLVGLILVALGVFGAVKPSGHHDFALPQASALDGLSVRERIVTIASSQIGYRTEPTRSYCNKYSFGWGVGASGCPRGERSEEWCADFAAWAWRHAGVVFTYGYASGDINASAASFYEWGLANGHWHPVSSGFRASPGDVAIYGLNVSGPLTAAHVAIVTHDRAGQAGPDVINGDGDRTGFSVVETGADEVRADTGDGGGAALAGYVSPS